MPVTLVKRSFSHCPLKKRPLKYDPDQEPDLPSAKVERIEPENLSTKPEDLRVTGKGVPPPISLVAGRGDSASNFEPYYQQQPPKGSGPLGPISLNAWPQYAPFEMFQPCHFPPLMYREGGSPPHVSPPLTHEPAYPVMRIEENHPHHNRFSPPGRLPVKRESYAEYSDESAYYSSYSTTDSNSSTSDKQIVPTNVNGSVRYQCSDCTKSYSTYSGLSKHIQFHCSSQNKKTHTCKFCEKVYVSLGALKMHIRTHTLPCKCPVAGCNKCFSRPWLLQGHIRTHTGEKPFSCQHCHRAFADRSNLRAHLQTHSESKKYSCKACPKTFSRMSLLIKHEEGGCSLTHSD